MSIVYFANEFLAFMEHYREDTFGCPNADMKDWANECKAHADTAGYKPIIQYYEDPYEYCKQIELFIPLLTGDSLIKEDQTAIEMVTETFLTCHNDLGCDKICMEFYAHLCKTSHKLTEIYHSLVRRFTSINRSLTFIEDHLWHTYGTVPTLLSVICSIRPDLFDETFHNVTAMTEDEREAVYDVRPDNITEAQLLSILYYDLKNDKNVENDEE